MACCFSGCSNTRKKNPDLTFFRFPKEKERRYLWMTKCRNLSIVNLSFDDLRNRVVCEEHFPPKCFDYSVLNTGRTRRCLFKFAVPLPASLVAEFKQENEGKKKPSFESSLGPPLVAESSPLSSTETNQSKYKDLVSPQRLMNITENSCPLIRPISPTPDSDPRDTDLSLAAEVSMVTACPPSDEGSGTDSEEEIGGLGYPIVEQKPWKVRPTNLLSSKGISPIGSKRPIEENTSPMGLNETQSTKYKKILPKNDKTGPISLPRKKNITRLTDDSDAFVLNLTGLNINKLEKTHKGSPASLTTSLFLDNNLLQTLPNLDTYKNLTKISLVNNQLDSLIWFDNLPSLRILDLSGNKITSLDGLWKLSHLTAVSLSRNCISILQGQNYISESSLEFLDLSSNKISVIEDLSMLMNLKELLLQQNEIKTLQNCKSYLPPSLSKLTLAENAIKSLGSVSELSCLPNLTDLSLKQNPCLNVLQLVDIQNKPMGPPRSFDFRPFVLTQCRNLKKIDGRDVQDVERLKADWLMSEEKFNQICQSSHDCHAALVTYLAEVCPVTPQGMKSATEGALPSDEAPSSFMSMDLPLNKKQKNKTVQNSSASNTSRVKNSSTVKNKDCSSSPCTHYIELIEEKAKNYKLKRQCEDLETQMQEMVEKFQLIETSLTQNGINMNDLLVKVEVEEDCVQ